MSGCLEDLELGANDYDEGPEESIPKDFDRLKFDRGRKFFQRNAFSCLMGMMCSLACGLSIKNLLDVLVATGKSSKPRDAFIRYARTAFHVVGWHYGDIFNGSTKAGKSIRSVRQIHNKAREFMMERSKNNDKVSNRVWISQYDMSLVQCGFMGTIVMYPKELGIRCSKLDLEDYVYFWRWVGFFLGIKDENNICYKGYDLAYKYCKEIEKNVLIPAMKDPSEEFFLMANAFFDGSRSGITSFGSILSISVEQMGQRQPYYIKLSLIDRFRILFLKGLAKSLYYIPGFSLCLSKLLGFIGGWTRIT